MVDFNNVVEFSSAETGVRSEIRRNDYVRLTSGQESVYVTRGRIESEEIEREGPERLLAGYDGILVPGGFGERGIEGKIDAIRFARERALFDF